MANKRLRLGVLVMVLVFGMMITGCDTVAERLFSFNNNSSHTVTISVAGGGSSFTLAPRQSQSVWLTGNVRISDITYSPANLVRVSRSGNAFSFRDR